MTRNEYQRLKAHFEEEYRKNIEGLERVYRASVEEAPAGRQKFARPPQSAASPSAGDLRQAVLQAKGSVPAEFTRFDVERFLKGKEIAYGKRTLKGSMRALLDEGHTELITTGSGRLPNVYKWKSQVAKGATARKTSAGDGA